MKRVYQAAHPTPKVRQTPPIQIDSRKSWIVNSVLPVNFFDLLLLLHRRRARFDVPDETPPQPLDELDDGFAAPAREASRPQGGAVALERRQTLARHRNP